MSGANVSSGGTQRAATSRTRHVPSLQIQGGGIPGGGGLPRCYLCGMHMPAGRIIRHSNTVRCNRNIYMRWKRQDVAITDKCSEALFSLTGED